MYKLFPRKEGLGGSHGKVCVLIERINVRIRNHYPSLLQVGSDAIILPAGKLLFAANGVPGEGSLLLCFFKLHSSSLIKPTQMLDEGQSLTVNSYP